MFVLSLLLAGACGRHVHMGPWACSHNAHWITQPCPEPAPSRLVRPADCGDGWTWCPGGQGEDTHCHPGQSLSSSLQRGNHGNHKNISPEMQTRALQASTYSRHRLSNTTGHPRLPSCCPPHTTAQNPERGPPRCQAEIHVGALQGAEMVQNDPLLGPPCLWDWYHTRRPSKSM